MSEEERTTMEYRTAFLLARQKTLTESHYNIIVVS